MAHRKWSLKCSSTLVLQYHGMTKQVASRKQEAATPGCVKVHAAIGCTTAVGSTRTACQLASSKKHKLCKEAGCENRAPLKSTAVYKAMVEGKQWLHCVRRAARIPLVSFHGIEMVWGRAYACKFIVMYN